MKMESVLLAFWFSVTGLRLASLLTRRRSLAYAVGTLVVFVLPCLAVSLFIERPLSGLFVWLILPAGIYLVGKFLYGFSDMERKLAETAERGPLGVSQNPGPVPRDNAESWLSKLRKKKIHFMGYPDRPGWEDALQIIRTRIAHAGGEIVESAEEEAEYLIWVDAFVASSCTYEITSVIETHPKVRKVFEPYALLLSRQMPQLDMAIDLAYDLCVFIDKYPVESPRRPPDKLAGT